MDEMRVGRELQAADFGEELELGTATTKTDAPTNDDPQMTAHSEVVCKS